MKKNIFDYKDYKTYLEDYITSQPKGGRGLRGSLAEKMGVPVSHISQVLNGKSQLSMEQAEAANEFLGHTDDEAQFFMLLVQLNRAGTPELRKRLNRQVQQILEKRLILKERLGVTSAPLSAEQQSIFYSSWLYAAVQVALTIPRYRVKEEISSYLGISLKKTGEILEFLVSNGLAVQNKKGQYEVGTARIHLGSDSPLISKFHSNWRLQAIKSLEREDHFDDLHYSSVVTISAADFMRIKSILVKNIEDIKPIIRDSPAEDVHCLCLDFFRLK